jgi:AmmeMemoRadiSam system protein A
MGYDAGERDALLGVAREAVAHGVRTGRLLEVDSQEHPERLCELRACFVTLRKGGALRGCTGSLEATRPLVSEVARSAHRTALSDPRFEPVREQELPELQHHISVLTPLEPLPADSERALLAALEPGRDGLVLHEGTTAATFLPSVWGQVHSAREFLEELRRKAGLPRDHWSPRLWFERYRAEDIG